LDDVIVPKAEDLPAAFPQSSVPHIVIANTAVLAAIGLHDEPSLYAGKVDNIRRYRVLPSKAPAELVVPEPAPKQPFRLSCAPAQTASERNDRMPTPHSRMLT
jgi:hypothetical protein